MTTLVLPAGAGVEGGGGTTMVFPSVSTPRREAPVVAPGDGTSLARRIALPGVGGKDEGSVELMVVDKDVCKEGNSTESCFFMGGRMDCRILSNSHAEVLQCSVEPKVELQDYFVSDHVVPGFAG